MTITSEISLQDFQAWSGGRDTLNRIINLGKCDELENTLDELYPNGMSAGELNDLLWFEEEQICEWLGIRTYDTIKKELEETQEEIDCLQSDYESDIEDEELTEEEIQDIYETYYKDDIEELKERIEELEEELDCA